MTRQSPTHTVLAASIAVLFAVLRATIAFSGQMYVWDVTITRHQEVADFGFGDFYADTKLAVASSILQTNDFTCGDIICCTAFIRSGDVGTYTDSYFAVGNETQLKALFASHNYQVFMVLDIQNIKVPGPSEAAEAFNGRKVAINVLSSASATGAVPNTWAIALGLSRGIPPTTVCNTRLMYSGLEVESRTQLVAVDGSECNLFKVNADRQVVSACGGATSIGTSLQATGGPSRVTLTWTESDKFRSIAYGISRSDRCWGPGDLSATVLSHDPAYTSDSTHYTFVDNTATYTRPYYYVVNTLDETVNATATPTSGTNPQFLGPPTNLSAQAHYGSGSFNSVQLNWAAGDQGTASGYHVYRKIGGGMADCTTLFHYLGIASTTSFQDAAAPAAGIPVSYRVRGFNSTIGSDVSNQALVTLQLPNASASYYVPQSGSVGAPNEGSTAVALLRACPNNDGGSSLPNNARIKIVLRDGTGAPLSGVPASEVFVEFSGGTPAQGFSGAGADSVIANSQYNQAPLCPDVRRLTADAATDANGVTYVTFHGSTPGSPGVASRDSSRKWGHYDSELPVYALGIKLQGRLTSPSANGSYVLQIKNFDLVGGLGTAMNLGEAVSTADYNSVATHVGQQDSDSPNNWWRDFDSDGYVTGTDLYMVHWHQNHNCASPNNP